MPLYCMRSSEVAECRETVGAVFRMSHRLFIQLEYSETVCLPALDNRATQRQRSDTSSHQTVTVRSALFIG